MYILVFVTFKFPVRRIIQVEFVRLIPSQYQGISIPRSMFLNKSASNSKEYIKNLIGLIFGYWCSIYSIYKALKKYKYLKYIVSITRVSSRLIGILCSLYIPIPFRFIFYGAFAKIYGINMEEYAEPDYCKYETFTKFFTRTLKPGVRTITEPDNESSMCSPCDGRVLTCGRINSEYSTIDCVKGRSYRLDEFMLGYLGNPEDDDQVVIPNNRSIACLIDKVKNRGNQLLYMVIYLSPADYHRFHSPCVHSADYRRHIVGYLSPVKPSHVNRHKDVFKNNERVNIFGRWKQGFYFQSAVGATNVGSIKLDFDEDVLTNQTFPRYPYF